MALPFGTTRVAFTIGVDVVDVHEDWVVAAFIVGLQTKGLSENVVGAMLLDNSLGLDDAVLCGDVVGNVDAQNLTDAQPCGGKRGILTWAATPRSAQSVFSCILPMQTPIASISP